MDKPRERIQAQNYATMGIYNQGSQIRVPTPATSGLYVVPVFGTYGYTSLTGERIGMPPSGSGYFYFRDRVRRLWNWINWNTLC